MLDRLAPSAAGVLLQRLPDLELCRRATRRKPSASFYLWPTGEPKVLNLITPRHRQAGRLTGDLFGVIADRDTEQRVIAGFLLQREQFGAAKVLLDPNRLFFSLTA
jgi:hypothetical protein